MENLLKKKLSVNKISIIITVLFLLSLIPILLLGLYNYPGADDFSSAAAGFTAWRDSGSVFSVLKAVTDYTVHLYLTWTGDFVTTFLTILQPGVFGDRAYFIVPFLSIGALSTGAFYFGKVLLRDTLKLDKPYFMIITITFLFISIQRMVSGVEAFYWYSGVSNYIYPFALELFLLGFLLKLFLAHHKKEQMKYIVLCILFESMLGFCTYLAALQVLIINCSILSGLLIFRQKDKIRRYIVPVLFFMICFCFNVMAPGNQVRMQGDTGFSAVKSILISFYECLQYPFEKWMDFSLIAVLLFLIPFMWKAVKRTGLSFRLPLLVPVYSYLLLSAMFTPALFGSGSVDAGRLQNEIFLTFVLLLMMNEFYLIGWFRNRYGTAGLNEEYGFLTGHALIYTMFMTFVILFGAILVSKPESSHFTTASALESLANGEAAAYQREIEIRRLQLYDDKITDVILKPLTVKPYLLFFSDVKSAEDWENLAMCRYYGKARIEVKA